jgi:hypothetical protein
MERGCVEDHPQPVEHGESLEDSEGLRLRYAEEISGSIFSWGPSNLLGTSGRAAVRH